MAIFQNLKEFEYYIPGLLEDINTKDNRGCWLKQSIVLAGIDVNWQGHINRLANDPIFKTKEMKKIVKRFFKSLNTEQVQNLLNEEDKRYLEQYLTGKRDKTVYKTAKFYSKTQDTHREFDYNVEARRDKNRIKMQMFRDEKKARKEESMKHSH